MQIDANAYPADRADLADLADPAGLADLARPSDMADPMYKEWALQVFLPIRTRPKR